MVDFYEYVTVSHVITPAGFSSPRIYINFYFLRHGNQMN